MGIPRARKLDDHVTAVREGISASTHLCLLFDEQVHAPDRGIVSQFQANRRLGQNAMEMIKMRKTSTQNELLAENFAFTMEYPALHNHWHAGYVLK